MIPNPLPFEFHGIFDSVVSQCIGKKFCHLGRNPIQGFDCLGLISWVYPKIGLEVEIPAVGSFYSRNYWVEGATQHYLVELEKQFVAVSREVAQKGDIYLFSPKRS